MQAARNAGDASGESGARINLGSIARQRGQYDQAVVEFEQAAAAARKADDETAYANAQANLGITLDLGGLHAEALEAQGEALKIYERIGKYSSASAVLVNLGNTLSALGDTTRAREHYQRALELKQTQGIRKGVGSVLNNLADLALESGTTEQAVKLLDQAIAAHEADGDRIGQGLALSNRGVAHARAGRFDAALSDIQHGEAIARELEHAVGISAALRSRAETWLLRARILEGEPRNYALLNAEREARAAVASSSEADDPNRRLGAKRLLADVFAARGDAERAVAMMKEIEVEEAAIRAQRDDARVAVVRARYERQQVDADVALLREREAAQRAELARSRLMLRSALGLGIAGLTAIVLLFWIGRERRIRADALREQGEALRQALAEAEAQGRRAQATASLNHRLLALAGDDLQAPLLEIRGNAERLLATYHANPNLSGPMAVIARHASALIQTVLRIREAARAAETPDDPDARADLASVLERCVTLADARAQQRQQRLLVQITPGLQVTGDDESFAHLFTELIDHALRENPADCNIDVRLQREASNAVLTLSDHEGNLGELLPDAPSRRRGLGLLREDVIRLGGRIESVRARAPDTGQWLRILLPITD